MKKDDAKTNLDALVQKLTKRETEIKDLDAQVKDKKVTKEEADKQKAQFKKGQTAAASVSAAYRACAEGKELSESDYDLAGIFSSVKGEPNETSIGLIAGGVAVIVLGSIAALLPQLKAIFPRRDRIAAVVIRLSKRRVLCSALFLYLKSRAPRESTSPSGRASSLSASMLTAPVLLRTIPRMTRALEVSATFW